MTTRAALYWHTVRHLRPIQIGGRIWAKVYKPSPELGPPPARRKGSDFWVMPARRAPSMTGEMTFRLLNETRRVDGGPWISNAPSQLWVYNVHYFDDLNAFDSGSRQRWHVQAVADWIKHHPPARGDAWAPYPTSLRVVNWIKWALGGRDLDDAFTQSLAIQIRSLRRRLEYHLLGNHLFANAKALVFAGLFFQGQEADRWLDKGMALLAREIPEQILADGGQFERSPMYHALALEDVLDLINIATAFQSGIPQKWSTLVASWPALARRMRGWLMAMCHPDAEISFFNDAAIGVAPSPTELDRYTESLTGSPFDQVPSTALRFTHLSESGYARLEASHAVLLMDVGPVGPDYLPAHAHADTLSFELSVFGQRVIVNGGTSCYGTGPDRNAERGTPSHSTVTIDEQDSSEVWKGFRVARRARPLDLAVQETAAAMHLSCAHDGYRRLPGKPVHRRSWRMQAGTLRVEDQVEGRYRSAVARYHLHPLAEPIVDQSSTSGRLRLPGGNEIRWHAAGPVRVDSSSYAPEFGRRIPTRCLTLLLKGASPTWMELSW